MIMNPGYDKNLMYFHFGVDMVQVQQYYGLYTVRTKSRLYYTLLSGALSKLRKF